MPANNKYLPTVSPDLDFDALAQQSPNKGAFVVDAVNFKNVFVVVEVFSFFEKVQAKEQVFGRKAAIVFAQIGMILELVETFQARHVIQAF